MKNLLLTLQNPSDSSLSKPSHYPGADLTAEFPESGERAL